MENLNGNIQVTRENIIERLYMSKDIDRLVFAFSKKLDAVNQDFLSDIKQELFLILMQKGLDFLWDIEGRGKLKFYLVSVIMRITSQPNNVIHQTFKGPNQSNSFDYDFEKMIGGEWDDALQIREEQERREDADLDDFREKIQQLDEKTGSPFYRCVAELVSTYGTQREVARLTGIHYSAISRAMKRVKEELQ